MTVRESPAGSGQPSAAGRKRWWVTPVKLILTVGVTWLILRGAGVRLSEVGTVDWRLVRLNVPYLVLSVARYVHNPFGLGGLSRGPDSGHRSLN